MASQRITIAKIGGASAAAVISQFQGWSAARNIDDPTELRSDQWPESVRRDVNDFANSLRSNGHQPPVIYLSEHIDLWSMGDVFERWLSHDGGGQPIHLHSDRFELWCYPLPDAGLLANHLQRSKRLKRIRERKAQEERWLTVNLLEAILAWDGMAATAVLVLVREVFGGLVMDSDLEHSLVDIPEWIYKRNANAT
jgi:hypothetical protein